MKRKFIILGFALIVSLSCIGCGKTNNVVEDVQQGDMEMPEERFIEILSENINNSIEKNTDFTLSIYEDELNTDNLFITYKYTTYDMILNTYYHDTGLDVYDKTTIKYWVDPVTRLTYVDTSYNREENVRITNFIPLTNIINNNLGLGDEKIVNAVNCYTLVATLDDGYIEYYISKDEYILIGAKFVDLKTNKEIYKIINYSATVQVPDSAMEAIRKSYSEYLEDNE